MNTIKIDLDKISSSIKINFRLIFRAFQYRNYRLYFAGQGISLIGSWMQSIALSWLVYRLTNSAFLLGLVRFSGEIPIFIFTPLAGVIIDRWERRKILIITQILALLQALVLSILVLTHSITIWQIIILSIIMGIINSFDMPGRQSFVIEMVDKKEDLGNAIALNSSMFNLARLIGPSLAGILIATVGEGICFLVNSISYLSAILALIAMKLNRKATINQGKNVFIELRQGAKYVLGFTPIRYILTLIITVSLLGTPYVVLLPIFAKTILKGGPQTLGFLMAGAGIGALIGALYLASQKTVVGLGKIIPIATTIFGIGLLVMSRSHIFQLSLVMMLFIGFGMMVQMASSNTFLQTIVDDDKRGRVMSFYTLAFMGTMPLGSLLAGFLASKIGAQNTVLIGGLVSIVSAIIFAQKLPYLRTIIRPIYQKMGILPEVTTGIQTATNLQTPPED
ncbi:MAG: MFS transporter [candidate division WOR-3 bacterium]|nr:MFS transporter [candidate division WOR-3 bacterium]